jgi:hypothetical protein
MVDGVVDALEGIGVGDGWIRTAADGNAAVDNPAKLVGSAVTIAQALLIHTARIAPQPFIGGLHAQNDAQAGSPLHLGGCYKLRMLDAVAHGAHVIVFRGGLQRLEHGLDGGVANGVKANLQIVLAALHGKMCQRILSHIEPPLPMGRIGIVKGKGRCPAAHGAVDIQGAADMLEAVLQGTLILGGLIENLYAQRIAVLIAHQELTGAQRALLCLGAPALHGGHGGKAMGKGYAQCAGGSGIKVIIGIGVQHVALQPVFRLIGEDTCGNTAVIHMDARQGKGNLIIQDAHD